MPAAKTRLHKGERQRLVTTRDPRTAARNDEYRGRGDRIKEPRGKSERCKAGRAKVHRNTLECRRCGAAVDWMQAKAQATKRARRDARRWKTERGRKGRGGAVLRDGDGCSSKCCTAARNKGGYRSGEHVRRQREYAEALRSGERILVEWPRSTADPKVWQRPDEARDAVVWHAGRIGS